jgi:hypothetical protein
MPGESKPQFMSLKEMRKLQEYVPLMPENPRPNETIEILFNPTYPVLIGRKWFVLNPDKEETNDDRYAYRGLIASDKAADSISSWSLTVEAVFTPENKHWSYDIGLHYKGEIDYLFSPVDSAEG